MIIIGTAGHIDHGKTSLVGALSGIETDRLSQEQERGISIELGFAYLDLPDGTRCGVVDVPGHERFVRQMIAGATGIDLVILVVAADEGVMQQTREHLDICRLLGIRHGLVALTKVDLVDDEWLELVESDTRDALEGTFLEDAPFVHFSAPDESTHGALVAAIADRARVVEKRREATSSDAALRLPVDRVFTMRGFGTVITGTVCSGTLRNGDAVTILPSEQRSKVRGIQSHGATVKEVMVGQRAAVNLQGLEKEAISRGDVLTHAGALKATRMLDLDLHLLPHVPKPLRSQAKALVHVGTEQATGTIVLLDREELTPGDTAPAQLRLDRFAVALGGDHVVLRGFELLESYGKTLGGGVIRHPMPKRHKRNEAAVLTALEALRTRDPVLMAEHAIRLESFAGAKAAVVRQILGVSEPVAAGALEQLKSDGKVQSYVQDGVVRYVHQDLFGHLLELARQALDAYHGRYAHRAGIPREELRSQLRHNLSPKYYAEIVGRLQADGIVEVAGQYLRRVGFVPTLSSALKALRDNVLRRYRKAGLEPPPPAELADAIVEDGVAQREDINEITELLVAQGDLHRVHEKLIFAKEHIRSLEERVVAFLKQHGEMTTPELKTLTGTTRKYTVPLAEYLDARKLTIRVGDVRKLRSS